jgi:hypothetical protein
MAGPGRNDNDPFQKLHATRAGSIGHFSVNAFKRFEFPQNGSIDLPDMSWFEVMAKLVPRAIVPRSP